MTDGEPNTKGHIWIYIFIVLVAFTAAVFYFSKDNPALTGQWSPAIISPTPSREPRTYTISYTSGVFSPTNLRIHVGDTVVFRNDGPGTVMITADFGTSGALPQGASYTFQFGEPGTFEYTNAKVASEHGTIIVKP